jgi:putative PEP-CTERM system TPR-repeat lipoprotein
MELKHVMRRSLLIGVPLLAVAAIVAATLVLRPAPNPLAAGKAALAAGDLKGAASYLREAVRAQPRSAEAALLLGRTDLSLGNAAAAELELRRARDNGATASDILYPLGEAYLAQGHANLLLQDFDPATAPASLVPEILALRAGAELSLHNVAQAQTLSNQAEAAAPRDPNVLIVAAKIALVAGDVDGASRRAGEVLAAQPQADPTERDDALLLQGEIAMHRGDPATALARAKSVQAHNALRLDAKLMQARALAATGQTAAARQEIAGVLKRSPKDVPANYLLTVLAVHAGDYAAAESALQKIGPAIGDLPRGFYFLAVTKLGLQQFAQAEDAANQFLAAAPEDPNGLKLMAYVDLARQRPDRALTVLANPRLSGQPDPDILDLKGRALAMTGDLKGAKAAFDQAAHLHPADPNVLNRLAAVELNLGHLAAGEADLKHSLDLAPKQAATGSAVVQTDLARGDLDAARADLSRMKDALGESDTIAVLDAEILLAGLDRAGAEATLKTALGRFPDSRAVTMALFRVERLSGEADEARALLEAALKRHPADAGLLSALLPELYARGETGLAVKLAEAAHDAAPGDAELSATLAEAYHQDKQTSRAIGLLDRASAGNNPALDLLRARYLAEDGKTDQAAAVIAPIVEKFPGDTGARLLLAGLRAKTGDFAAARRIVADGLKLAPGNMALLRGCVDLDLQQAGSAKAGLAAALATASGLAANRANLPAAYALPGLLRDAAGDRTGAASAYLLAYRAAPSSGFAIQAAAAAKSAGNAAAGAALLEGWTKTHPEDDAAALVLSSFYLDGGRLRDAAQLLQAVLTRQPGSAAALNNLAWIRQHEGDLGAAKALAVRAYFQSPSPDIADTLGWILQRNGETETALPLLKQAASVLHGVAAYHYAVALAASGDKQAARKAIKDALANGAAFRGREDAEKFSSSL